MWITIMTLVLAAAGFVWGRIRADIVALIALLILTLSGILTTQEALSGFSNPHDIRHPAVLSVLIVFSNSTFCMSEL
jgi:di/tricarboxylate transporter